MQKALLKWLSKALWLIFLTIMVFAKKPPLLVTIGTAVLLVVSGTIAHWGLQLRAKRARGLPVGIGAVPEEAVAVVSFSTNPEQWQRLRQFGTPETQTAFDERLGNWRDRWLIDNGISFNDLKPWIGPEVTLAWLSGSDADADASAVGLNNQRRLLLLPIADPEAARITADVLLPETESADSIEYRGVTLSSYLPASGKPDEVLWIALLGTQLLLVAEDEMTAQQAIDAYKGGNSIANIPGYRRSFEFVGKSQAFGKVYINVPQATQVLAATSQPPLPSTLLDSFQDSRGIVATITLASQGIKIESMSWLGPGSDRTYADTNVAAQLPQYLPRNTLVMASGGNFQQFWQDLSDQNTWGAFTAFDPDNLALALQGSTGLALENDLLPWMSGEFALALVPPDEKSLEQGDTDLPNPGLIAFMQVSDRTKAEQAFAKLDEVVKTRYRFSIVNEPVGEVEMVKWISPFQALTLARGWIESSIAFLTVGTGTDAAIVPQPRRPLAKASLFQLTTGDAPDPNNGYFYLNLKALSQTSNNLFVPPLPVENQGALRAIQALGVTATVLDEQSLRYDLYIALERGNRPGPLPGTASSSDTPKDSSPNPEALPPTETPSADTASPMPQGIEDTPLSPEN